MTSVYRNQINKVKTLYRNLRRLVKVSIFKKLRKITSIEKSGLIGNGLYYLDFAAIKSNFNILFQDNKNITTKVLVYSDTEKTIVPKFIPEQKISNIKPTTITDEIALLDINDARFSLRNNQLVDPNLKVVCDGAFRFEDMTIYRNFLSKTIHVNGTVAYLFDPTPMNYYHWMCRVLPKLAVYQTIIDIKEIDFFYIGKFKISNFHRESLEKAGIKSEQIIQHGCTADRIIAAIHNNKKYPWPYSLMGKKYCMFTKNLFVNEKLEQNRLSCQHPKRIYISRQSALKRKIINIHEVLDLLQMYGVEPMKMDGLTIEEQVKLFSQAEAIIAPHGAALTNLLFIQQQTKVIEIMPYGYVDTMYYLLSSYAKAEYFYLIGEKRQVHSYNNNQNRDDIKSTLANRDCDIYVDLKKLDTLCKMAFT